MPKQPGQYIGQQKTLGGIIFHYVKQNRKVESMFYTNRELKEFADKGKLETPTAF